jgi:hypothetical protein
MTLLLYGAAHAQGLEVPNIEYPNDLCELRRENRVFIHAPLATRQKLLKELREHSDLSIVERPEDADFLLLFTYTPFSDGTEDGGPPDAGGAMAARAELTVVKFVSRREEQARPRILFYWSEQKSFHSVPIPLKGLSPTGFASPRSGKSAAEELIVRLTLWAIHKKWPHNFYFDQFTNQLTISTGGKLEANGAKAFVKELKNARSDEYARRCAPRPVQPPDVGILPTSPTLRTVPDPAATAEPYPTQRPGAYPPIKERPQLNEGRPRSVRRSKKGSEER